MSESMTVVEIEDVLSSIRRLVSEDLRPTHKLVSAALQNGANKLILTPALRVVGDARTVLPERGDPLDQAADLQTVLLEIEDDAEGEPAEFLPVFGSIRLQDPLILTAQAAMIHSGGVADANFLTSAMSRIHGMSTVEGADGASETIEAVVAAVGAAVGPDEWEPDGGEPAPQAEAFAQTVWSGDVGADEAVAEIAVDETVDPDPTAAAIDEADAGAWGGDDSIVFHAAKAVDASTEDDDADDLAGYISEDVLREIVRDMIREELQGSLGERITRNVRKLVRAEINRALVSRDFDEVASRG